MAKILQVCNQSLLRTLTNKPSIRCAVTAAAEYRNAISENALATAKPFEQIPGFKIVPFFGTAWVFMPLIGKYSLKRSLQYDVDKYKKFGPISRDIFGKFRFVTITNPNDIEAVFRNEGDYPARGELSSVIAYRKLRKDWFPQPGILVLEGKEWYNLRVKVQKNLLKTTTIERYVPSVDAVSRDLVHHIRRIKDHNNEVPDLIGQLLKWALESVACVTLNTRLGCLNNPPTEEGVKMAEAAHSAFLCMNELEAFTGNIQYWKWFSTPNWRKFVRTMDNFSQTAFKYANQTLEQIQKKSQSLEEEEMTMMESMLATKGLDLGSTVTMVVDMLLGGVDTTSHTSGFFFYALAKNPEKQEKLHQEIIRFLPNPTDRLTAKILREMTYLKHCFKESQRLYPIVRGMGRKLEQDIVLSGYKIPAGVNVYYPFYVAPRMDGYFKNAEQFTPERWADVNNKPHPFALLPFGFGPRSCIGRRLAEIEVQSLVIEMIRNFKVEYHYEDIGMITKMVNIPDHPFRFTFLERRSQT